MARYELSETNSGGSFWLSRSQYERLFAAGWSYEPDEFDLERGYDTKPFGGRGDDVPYGWRHNTTIEADTIREAVESFEAATGEDFFALGCTCCGPPFTITCDEPYEYISGSDVSHVPVRPW